MGEGEERRNAGLPHEGLPEGDDGKPLASRKVPLWVRRPFPSWWVLAMEKGLAGAGRRAAGACVLATLQPLGVAGKLPAQASPATSFVTLVLK